MGQLGLEGNSGIAGYVEKRDSVMAQQSKRIVPQPKKLVCTPQNHRTTGGLEFWYEHESKRIATSNPSVSLNFVRTGGMEAVLYLFLKLDGLSIQIGQKGGRPFPPSVYQGPKRETTWEIGSLGMPLYFDTLAQTHTSRHVHNPSHRFEPVALDEHFISIEQQEDAIAFLKEALAKYSGEWIGACRGEEQHAKVYLRPELEEQLAAGQFLK